MSSTAVYKNPSEYDRTSFLLLRDANQSLDKYFHLLKWKEGERVVDIGCGAGNVTTQVLLPRLPTDYKLLVGFDISEHNVEYAAENYGGPRITYVLGDIIEHDFQKLKGFFEKESISIGFDKVFSFHCLHWVKNSAQWSKNIYSLLKRGGQTFLQFATYATFMEVWIETAFSEMWIPYTKTVGPIRSEFHYSTDVNGDLTKVMNDAGFVVESCDHYTCAVDKQLPHEISASLMLASDPYVHTIPEELHSEYFKDLLRVFKKYISTEAGINYTVAVIVASKPEN